MTFKVKGNFFRPILVMLILLSMTVIGDVSPATVSAQGCGGSISYGGSVVGQIPYVGAVCRYSFTGSAGDLVTVSMTESSATLDPWLDLVDPTGKTLVSDDDSGGDSNSLISNYRLAGTGAFTILARAHNNASAGQFTVQLTRGCGGRISDGVPVDGTITSVGQRCQYTFNGNAGNTVTITMDKRADTLDPWLDLVDPLGSIVASDDDSGGNSNSLISNYRLRTGGTYTIITRAYNDASTGSFRVTLILPR